MATPERAASAGSGRMSWPTLLRAATIAAIVNVVLINVFSGEVIPPLLVFGVIWIGALVWFRRATKGPAILLLVSFVAMIALSAPFTFPSLAVPASAGDFILNVLGLLAALTGIVAAVQVIRGQVAPVPAARSLGLAAVVLFVLGSVFAVYSAATYDDAVMQEGDIELVAKDIAFEETSLESDGGEVSVFVDNEDATLHTFTIDELDVSLDVPASKSARVTFDAEPGEYEFFCQPHKDTMKGTLTVR